MKLSKQQKNLLQYLVKRIDMTGYNYDGGIHLDTLNNANIVRISEKGEDDKVYYDRSLVREWLLGLPSCLDIAFTYYDIKNVLLECGYKNASLNGKYQDIYYWNCLAWFIQQGEVFDGIVEKLGLDK